VKTRRRCALFVLPLKLPSSAEPVAAWATTGGWAQGAEEVLGSAWVVSDSGTLTPEQAVSSVTGHGSATGPADRRRQLSGPPATLARDARRALVGWKRARRDIAGPWDASEVAFVWQRHVLFRRDGLSMATNLKVPFVLSVHALQVRESASWGVRRPGWGAAAERLGEVPQLRAADLVACVSDGVAGAVSAAGVPDERVIVTPNGVDFRHFRPHPSRDRWRRELGLQDRFVLGWSGSFRAFHGLETAIQVMARLESTDPDVALLLIGDGPFRHELQSRVRSSGLSSVHFTGAVDRTAMPGVLSACDAGLVLSDPHKDFHYSPVKLREYLACELPVVAQSRGEIAQSLRDQEEVLLVDAGSVEQFADAVRRLRSSPALRAHLGTTGRRFVIERWSWARQVEVVLDALERVNR